jgi:hypothetical protein
LPFEFLGGNLLTCFLSNLFIVFGRYSLVVHVPILPYFDFAESLKTQGLTGSTPALRTRNA